MRRIASLRGGKSSCSRRQSSIAARKAGGSLIAVTGVSPVGGRPRFFFSAFSIFPYYGY